MITTSLHHYLKICCCKLDISNYTTCREIIKLIYYTFLLSVCLVYNFYYFNYKNLILDKIDFVLGFMVLLSFSLILLYVLNLIYVVFIIIKNKQHLHRITPQITPQIQNNNENTNIQVGVDVIVNN